MSPAQRERVRAELARLGDAPGVIAVGGPWRTAQVDAEIDGAPVRLRVQVRDAGPAAVDQPLVTAGHWLDDQEGVVLEDGFAAAAGLQPGDTITIAGQRVPVRGAALTVDVGTYPTDQPAWVWISPPPPPGSAALDEGGYSLELRLADPTRPSRSPPPTQRPATPGRRQERAVTDIEELAAVFGILAIFVVVLTIGTAVILVAGRMAAQIRQVGTLKAVGATPGQVTCVLLVEYLAVASWPPRSGWPPARCWRRRWPASPTCCPCTAPRNPITWPAPRPPLPSPPPSWSWPRCGPPCAACGAAPCGPSPATPGHRTGPAGWSGDHRLPLPAGMAGAARANRRRGRFLANTLGLTVGITLLITALALRTGVDAAHQQGLSIDEPDAISAPPKSRPRTAQSGLGSPSRPSSSPSP